MTLQSALRALLGCLLLLTASISFNANAQSQKIYDYVLYSDSGGVQIGSSITINKGSIGSSKLVQTTGNATINANIHSGGIVSITNSNVISGKISARNSDSLKTTVLSVGSSAVLSGNIDVNGNIVVGGGSVSGTVTHPPGTTYSGPSLENREVIGTPILPSLPTLPAITTFPLPPQGFVPVDVTGTKQLNPGWYKNVILTGNKKITLKGPGTYVFDKINCSGNSNSIVFDFPANATGNFYIYVKGDADFGKLNASITGDGTAARIFTETHGLGATSSIPKYSFVIANGSSGTEYKWLGTVWAPFGGINIGSGTGSSNLAGALYSGKQVALQSGVTFTHVPFGSDNVVITPFNPITSFKVNTIIGAELTSLTETVTEEATKVLIIQDGYVWIDVIVKTGRRTDAETFLFQNGMMDTVSNGSNELIITGKFPIANLLLLNDQQDIINFVRPVYAPIGSSGLIKDAGDTAMGTYLLRNGFKYEGANIEGDGIKVGVISDSYNKLKTQTNDPASNDIITGDLPGSGNPVNETPVQVILDYPYAPRSDEGRAMLQIIHDIAPKAHLAFRTGFISQGDFAEGILKLQKENCDIIVDDVTFINEPYLKDGPVAKAVDQVKSLGVSYFSSAGNFGSKSYEAVYKPIAPPAGFPDGTQAHDFSGTGDIYQKITLKPGSYTIALQWEDDIYSLGETSAGGTKNDFDLYLTDVSGNPICGYNRINTNGDPFEFLAYTVASTVTEIDANILITRANTGTIAPRIKYIIFRGNAVIAEWSSGISTIVGHANANGAVAVAAVNYYNTPAFGTAPVVAPYSSIGGQVGNLNRNKPDISAPDGVNTSVNMGPDISRDADPFSNFFGTSAAAPHVAAAAALILDGHKKYKNVALTPDGLKAILQGAALPFGTQNSAGAGLIQPDEAMRSFASPTPYLISIEYPTTITPTTPPTNSFTLTINGDYLSETSQVLFRGEPLTTTTFISNTELTAIIPAFTGNPSIQVYTPPLANGDGGYSNTILFFDIPKKTIIVKGDNKTKKYGEVLPVFTSSIFVYDPVTEDTVSLSESGLTLANIGLENISYATNATSNSDIGNQYFIKPVRIFDPENATDQGLLEIYIYDTIPGTLTIQRLPVTVTPNSQSIVYGSPLEPITFKYDLDPSANIDSTNVIQSRLSASHQEFLANDYLGVLNNTPAYSNGGLPVTISNGLKPVTISNGVPLVEVNGDYVPIINPQSVTVVNGLATATPYTLTSAEVANLSFLVSNKAIQNARLLDNQNKIIDISQEVLLKFYLDKKQTTLVNSVPGATAKGMLGTQPLINKVPITISNGLKPVTISNGSVEPVNNGVLPVTISNGVLPVTISNGLLPVTISNGGLPVTISNGGLPVTISNAGFPITISNSLLDTANRIAVIIDSADAIESSIDLLQSVNAVTGLTAGTQYIIPATLMNDNFAITYAVGTLNITKAPLTITANDTSKPYGELNPPLTANYTGFKLGEDLESSDVQGTELLTTSVTQFSPIGSYPIQAALGTLASSNYSFIFKNGTFTVTTNPCLITHSPFGSFNSTPKPDAPTTLWLNLEIKVSGQLKESGDYISFSAGTVTLNNLTSNPVVNNTPIPNGKIIADALVTEPVTHYEHLTNTWITRVPLGFSSASDIFLTGAIINSSTGFIKKNNYSSVVKGIFKSSEVFSDQWTYAMATYRPQFTYNDIDGPGDVTSINGTYRAGTPTTQINNLVGGGNNYTGSSSSYDNFTACQLSNTNVITQVSSTPLQNSLVEKERTNFYLMPNPATSQVTLSYVPTISGNMSVKLFSVNGTFVAEYFNGKVDKNKMFQKIINTSTLPAGLYIIQLRNGDHLEFNKLVLTK